MRDAQSRAAWCAGLLCRAPTRPRAGGRVQQPPPSTCGHQPSTPAPLSRLTGRARAGPVRSLDTLEVRVPAPPVLEQPRGQQAHFRQDRDHRRARQAPRLRLRLRGDLRRYPVGLGLRPAGRGAEGEHQAAVVAHHGHRPRGRRRPGQLGDPAPPGVGGLRARQRVPRPAGGVPELPPAVPRRPAGRGVHRAHRQAGGRGRPVRRALPELRHPRRSTPSRASST